MIKVLNELKRFATRWNIKFYPVGGTVRDLLLGKEEFGIDIVVEEGALHFANLLQKTYGGKVIFHQDFMTATLIGSKIGKRIDLATPRKEIYPYPSALPRVVKGSLYEDLFRRDFTINAIAMDINRGKLIDPLKGEEDLKKGIIKVLHRKSFIDDPTRIFRAVRFSERLGFKIEKNTFLWMEEAIRLNYISNLSPKRIKNEILLIFKEDKRYKILKLMKRLKILEKLNLYLPSYKLFHSLSIEKLFFPSVNSWFSYFLLTIKKDTLPQLIELTKKEKEEIKKLFSLYDKIHYLRSTTLPSSIYKLLRGSSVEVLLTLCTKYPSVKWKVLDFYTEYQKVTSLIKGKDLLQMKIKKGPIYKEILDYVLYAKMDGKVKNKEEEKKLVKEFLERRGYGVIK
jgi:tRNA nucleotidyltransferase/poly(A) polymerase